MDLPLVSFGAVYHIGTLDPADKGVRGSSYEGHGLSVSLYPAEWEAAAKLGGLPWWRLEKEGGLFLDAHRLSKAQRKAIADWGAEQGYAERVTVWHAVRWDDELDCETWFVCESKEEAELEADDDGHVRRRRDLKGTPKLDALVGQKAGLACFDLLLVAYAQEETELDGVHWEDELGYLSAPRSVILPGKVAEWQAEQAFAPKPQLSPFEQVRPSAATAALDELSL